MGAFSQSTNSAQNFSLLSSTQTPVMLKANHKETRQAVLISTTTFTHFLDDVFVLRLQIFPEAHSPLTLQVLFDFVSHRHHLTGCRGQSDWSFATLPISLLVKYFWSCQPRQPSRQDRFQSVSRSSTTKEPKTRTWASTFCLGSERRSPPLSLLRGPKLEPSSIFTSFQSKLSDGLRLSTIRTPLPRSLHISSPVAGTLFLCSCFG